MGEKVLVTIELRFTTDDDPEALGERIREATSLIVGGRSWRTSASAPCR